MSSLSGSFLGNLRRELQRIWRDPGEAVHGSLLFILVVIIFPFATDPSGDTLSKFAIAIVWIAALLAATLSLDGLFRSDYNDGCLELMAAMGVSLAILGLAKACAHWLTTWLPLALLCCFAGLLLEMPADLVTVVVATLLLAGMSISLLGTPIAVLTVGLRGSGMLLALLILPMYIPLLIFGASAGANAELGQQWMAELYFLTGYFVLALSLAPWATAAAIRIRLS